MQVQHVYRFLPDTAVFPVVRTFWSTHSQIAVVKRFHNASSLLSYSIESLVGPVPFVTMFLVGVVLGMMAAGGPRPGMQQQLQEGWVASTSAPPLGQSGPAQQGVMPGRIGVNTAPMRAASQPRPMLHSPMMTNGERCAACNYSRLYMKYYILKIDLTIINLLFNVVYWFQFW